jgi:diketogulonate reductase-like aldo/keto reductase
MVNQFEVHPYCYDASLIEYCQHHHIRVIAYAPFASGAFGLLSDATLKAVAEEHKKSVGQIILRWLVQKGCVVLPKSSNPHRIAENQQIFDFQLSNGEVSRIDALSGPGSMKRSCPDPNAIL